MRLKHLILQKDIVSHTFHTYLDLFAILDFDQIYHKKLKECLNKHPFYDVLATNENMF